MKIVCCFLLLNLFVSTYAQAKPGCASQDSAVSGTCVKVDDKIVISNPSMLVGNTRYNVEADNDSADALCQMFGASSADGFTKFDIVDAQGNAQKADLASLFDGKFYSLDSACAYISTVSCN